MLAPPTRGRRTSHRRQEGDERGLEGAGLIVRRVEGTKRPCRLAPSAIVEIDQWLDTLRQALTKNYDRLDDVLAGMNAKKRKARR
jgi:hypothetical protein